MMTRLRAWRLVPLVLILSVGCRKPTAEKGELPARDPAKEAEAAARRAARMDELRPADAKLIEALRGRLPKGSLPAGNEQPISIYLRGDPGYVSQLVLSPDGSRVVTFESDAATKATLYRILDLASGREICRFKGNGGAMFQSVFSPDGTRFAVGGMDKHIRVWDAATGQPQKDFSFDNAIWSLTYTPDGTGLVASVAGRLILIDPESGQTRLTYADTATHTSGATVSPSGALVAASAGVSLDHVVLWEAATGRKINEWKMGSRSDVTFSPDGWSLLVKGVSGLVLRDIASAAEREVAKLSVSSPTFSPDGRLLAYTSGENLVLVDLASGAERVTKPVHSNVVGFFPGGSLLATFDNSTLRLWDVDAIRPPAAK